MLADLIKLNQGSSSQAVFAQEDQAEVVEGTLVRSAQAPSLKFHGLPPSRQRRRKKIGRGPDKRRQPTSGWKTL